MAKNTEKKDSVKAKPKRTNTAKAPKIIEETKGDSWKNILSGTGGVSDKTQRTKVAVSTVLVDQELSDIWVGEGVGSRIVSVVSEDATREWISIPQDESGQILAKLQSLDAQSKFQEALNWSRLYGGSAILMGYSDGGSLEKPIRNSSKSVINYLKVYEKPRITPVESSLIVDPKSPYYEDYELWNLEKLNGPSFVVHRSRLLFFKGVPVPKKAEFSDSYTRYWGMSVLQQPWDQIKDLGAANQGVANLLLEFNIGVFKIDGLANILAQNNVEAIKNRIEIINASKSVINSILIGENEEFRRDAAGLGGLSPLLDLFMTSVAGVSGIPTTKLFGKSPAGMNATGESDTRNYYDNVESFQANKMTNPIQTLVNAINKSLQVVPDENVMFEFLPVWSPSQAELIEMRKKQAEIDQIYWNMGALTTEQIVSLRFEGGYTFEMALPDPEAEEFNDPDEE